MSFNDYPRRNAPQSSLLRTDRTALRALEPQLDDGQKAMLHRLVKQTKQLRYQNDGRYHFAITTTQSLTPTNSRHDITRRLADELGQIDQMEESEALYRRFVQRLVELDILSQENYESRRIQTKAVAGGTTTYLCLTPQEIDRMSHVAGIRPPSMPRAERN